MSWVAIAKASSYDPKIVVSAIEEVCSSLEGLSSLLRGRVKIFIKINLLSPFSPVERAIYTHPLFARGVVEFLKNWNVTITIGDDLDKRRGDPFFSSGLKMALADQDIEFSYLKDKGFKKIGIEGEKLETILFSREALEADVLVNLPKLKTHSFTIFTGAIKNFFGLIPHGLRLKVHREHIWNEDFSKALVDIFSIRKPDLTLMDAVVAMEGEGPSSGNPRKVGLILASRDSVALDAVAGKIIGLEPFQVFTTWQAHNRGLGIGDLRNIHIYGEKLENILIPDFKLSAIAVRLFRRYLPSFLYAYFQDQLALRPKVKKEACLGCSDCQRACPVGAIKIVKGQAQINDLKCIHCLCCHESCSYFSVRLKQRPLGRLIRAAAGLWHRTRSLVS
ncbi:MAG: DUF362 domain-containing protein [Candidatus Aminicenantes bacterium]|nr:DUF362 domain-containing protein [Candidatus Aminicenantes bacterium]